MTIQKLHERYFQVLETERLLLRPLVIEDADAMFEYTAPPENFLYLKREPHKSPKEDREFIASILTGYQQHLEFIWGICLQGADRVIGTCRLFDIRPEQGCCEVSYLVHPACQGQGVASEVVGRLIRYAFEDLGLTKIYARCATGNVGSERVMQKCGMKLETILPRYAELHGFWHDFLLYAIEKEERAVLT